MSNWTPDPKLRWEHWTDWSYGYDATGRLVAYVLNRDPHDARSCRNEWCGDRWVACTHGENPYYPCSWRLNAEGRKVYGDGRVSDE